MLRTLPSSAAAVAVVEAAAVDAAEETASDAAAELAVVEAVVDDDPQPAMSDATIVALSTVANTFFFIFITSCEMMPVKDSRIIYPN